MKAFVTGATGFVGSHLVDKLLEKGFDVYAMVRNSSKTRWLDGKKVNYVKGDLYSNDILTETLKDMDYVFHVAGVIKSKTYEGFEKGNNLGTKNLIELVYKANPNIKKFVHVSSQAACGPSPDNSGIDENYIPKPITAYGITKRKAEEEVLKYKDKLPVTIVRPPAVFGPRDPEILIYFRTYQMGLNSIIGFRNKYLSLIYVEDLVSGILAAAFSEKSNGEIYFIGSDKAYNWNEISAVTSGILKKKALKLRIPHWFIYTAGYSSEFFSKFRKDAATLNVEKCKDITRTYWVCSNKKAKEQLGFNENYSLEEGFRKTIEWYKQNKWLK